MSLAHFNCRDFVNKRLLSTDVFQHSIYSEHPEILDLNLGLCSRVDFFFNDR